MIVTDSPLSAEQLRAVKKPGMPDIRWFPKLLG